MFWLATADGTTVNLHLEEILAAMRNIERQLEPVAMIVAFVLLVFGTMRGFLESESRKFMLNLLRAIIIVCLIGHWFQLKQWLGYAADGLTHYQVDVNVAALGQDSRSIAVGENVDEIRSLIQERITQKSDSKGRLSEWDLTNPLQAIQKLFNANVSHYLTTVLWHIYMAVLFICEWIVVMMGFLQRAIVVFLDLYVPIALAEFSLRSLQSQGQAFFRNYVGVHAWPVGWVFANLVTLALLQALPAPHTNDAIEILGAIVWSIPVLLWVIMGHVIGPFYAQKVVTRGGAELQAFAGAMVATVGGTSGVAYARALRFGAGKLRGLSESVMHPKRNHQSGAQGAQESLPGWAAVPEFSGGNASFETTGRRTQATSWIGGLLAQGAERSAQASDFAGGISETTGNVARTLGSMIANSSGNRIGPEGQFRFGSFRRTEAELNRSSRRARNYLN